MATLTIPNSFTNNVSTVDATTTNGNNSAIATQVNNIDRQNMGAAGIDATSLIPTTAAAATFGGITAGVGYKFLASATTSVPLTVSGIAAQTADLQDWTLTSGGTKALFVSSGGQLCFGNGTVTGPGGAVMQMSGDNAATPGLQFNVATGSTNGFRFLVNAATVAAQISASGNVWSGSAADASFPNLANVGFKTGAHAVATTAALEFGNAAATSNTTVIGSNGDSVSGIAGTIFEIINAGVAALVTVNKLGDLGILGTHGSKASGTTWENLSDERIKDKIADYEKGLDAVLALRPRTFTFNGADGREVDGVTHVGYIANEVQEKHPEMVRVVQTDKFQDLLALDTSDITPMLVNAVKSIVGKLQAAGMAGF